MDIEDVRKVASLARLELSDEELATYGEQLTQILGYVEVLDDVDIEGVEPMAHAAEVHNVFREDKQQPSIDRTDALANAPKTDGKFFQVPQILDQRDS